MLGGGSDDNVRAGVTRHRHDEVVGVYRYGLKVAGYSIGSG